MPDFTLHPTEKDTKNCDFFLKRCPNQSLKSRTHTSICAEDNTYKRNDTWQYTSHTYCKHAYDKVFNILHQQATKVAYIFSKETVSVSQVIQKTG